MNEIRGLNIYRERRKQEIYNATSKEYYLYLSIAGEIIWAGHGSSPKVSLMGSYMQQHVLQLKDSHLTEANLFPN